jgi:death-on-curing protein
MKWRWVQRHALLLLHGESLAEHGGGTGLRDEHLLDSALARPEHLAAYGEPDFADLAGSYGFGIARNHPFVDGNKRAAFLSVGLFLFLNGYRLQATQAEATLTVIALAAGEVGDAEFAAWIRDHSVKRTASGRRPR